MAAGPARRPRAPPGPWWSRPTGTATARFSRLADRAVTDVRTVLPRWRGRLVVEVPADEQQLGRVLGAAPDAYGGIAAVTTTVDGVGVADGAGAHLREPAGVRPARPAGRADRDEPRGHPRRHRRGRLLDADLAARGVRRLRRAGPRRPAGVGRPPSQILARVRARRAPGAAARRGTSSTRAATGLGASYESAWLACRLIGETYGEARLIAFYRAADRAGVDGRRRSAACSAPTSRRSPGRGGPTCDGWPAERGRLGVVTARRDEPSSARRPALLDRGRRRSSLRRGARGSAGAVGLGAGRPPGPGPRLGLFTPRADRPRRAVLLAAARRSAGRRTASRCWSLLAARPHPAGRPAAAAGDRRRAAGGWRVPLGVLVVLLVERAGHRCRSRPPRTRVDLRYGLSRQGWGGWAVDQAQAPAGVLGGHRAGRCSLVVAVARRSPRWWFAWAGAAALVLSVRRLVPLPGAGRAAVQPVHPDAGRPVQGSMLRLADREGVHVDDVLVADASRRTTTLNAYVSGLRRHPPGGGLRQPARPTLTPAEARVGDRPRARRTPSTTTSCSARLLGGGRRRRWRWRCWPWCSTTARLRRRAGCRGAGRPGRGGAGAARWPALGGFVVSPLQNTVSRAIEARADRTSIEATARRPRPSCRCSASWRSPRWPTRRRRRSASSGWAATRPCCSGPGCRRSLRRRPAGEPRPGRHQRLPDPARRASSRSCWRCASGCRPTRWSSTPPRCRATRRTTPALPFPVYRDPSLDAAADAGGAPAGSPR